MTTLKLAIPALPARDVAASSAFYELRLGFTITHAEEHFAILTRDRVDLHLWAACDRSWRVRRFLPGTLRRSGAETFIAGTASCRIEVDDIDTLYAELSTAGVLHPVDSGAPTLTEWQTLEFAALDLDGNLLTFFTRIPPR
jgi:catechol 2,3-dioxygenase-like lactoylglutathione lyase family enzyme